MNLKRFVRELKYEWPWLAAGLGIGVVIGAIGMAWIASASGITLLP